jgi:hypothetical protein
MKLLMQEAANSADLTLRRWNLGIVGQAIDERGRAAIDLIGKITDEALVLDYDPERFSISVNEKILNAEALDDELEPFKGKSIIVESTTLGFVELFLTCRAAKSLSFPQITFLYVEPRRYSKGYVVRTSNTRRSLILHKRDFELSDEVPGYRAIPGATLMLTDRSRQRSVFFLGYEARRLHRALEVYPMLRPETCSVVFGVPAFRPGWEMDAFANNVRIIKERNISGGVYFCGAENPASAVQVLESIHGELGEREKLFIAPIGTKPTGIGTALFAATHSNVGILYDHPKRRLDQSHEISGWHLYEADF